MRIDGTSIQQFVDALPRHRSVFHTRTEAEPDRVGVAGVLELGLVWNFTGNDNVLADFVAAVPDSIEVAGVSS